MVEISPWAWAGFFAVIASIMAVDLGYFHRRAHLVTVREAGFFAGLWISLGLAFAVVVWWLYSQQAGPAAGAEAAQFYVAGYILEESLSVDNLFVFLVVFGYFGVKGEDQHRVLFWGIIGAIMLRGAFIFAGVAALHAYEPTVYVLAGLLVFTAGRMAFSKGEQVDPSQARLYMLMKRILPFSTEPHEGKFFHIHGGRRHATSLFLCLILVEATDVLFALDSVPAVLGVTTDPFIVYTSNIFAIVGLRSLYFVVAAGLKGLIYLKPALVFLLSFIGFKMIISGPWTRWYDMPVTVSLAVVGGSLAVAIVASVLHNRRAQAAAGASAPPPGDGPPKSP